MCEHMVDVNVKDYLTFLSVKSIVREFITREGGENIRRISVERILYSKLIDML